MSQDDAPDSSTPSEPSGAASSRNGAASSQNNETAASAEALAERVSERARAAGRAAGALASDAARRVKAASDRALAAGRGALVKPGATPSSGAEAPLATNADAEGAPDGRAARWLAWLARQRPSGILVGALAVAGPILAVLTYANVSDQEAVSSIWFRLLIVLDICYLIALMGLVGLQIARLAIARRARSAGSKLHARMVAVFLGVAAAPTVIVAILFFFVIQSGVNAWFNENISELVEGSNDAAIAYQNELIEATRGQSFALAERLNNAIGLISSPADARFVTLLDQAAVEAGFYDVFVLNREGEIVARGLDTFPFDLVPPEPERLANAINGTPEIWGDAGELRALVPLDIFRDTMLYVSRPYDISVIETRQNAELAIAEYRRLETERDLDMAQTAALYLGFALLILTAAIYAGLWFAERLAKPIGRLAAAAQRVGSGDLVTRVKEEKGDDEIALLSRAFNRMTEEVHRKQEALKAASAESEQRRLFSEAVLSGVSAGVVGLDADGRIQLMNEPAARLLGLDPESSVGQMLADAAPEFKQLVIDARYDPALGVERPVRILRGGEELELMARITTQRVGRRRRVEGGFVVTLDDVTALVSAQRLAAWGDVARRIAHEIKNPLTPIQLAAERLKRKYAARLGDDAESFERYTETIVRQTGDIGRMVDAFSRFAKMPTPTMADDQIIEIVRQALTLQQEAGADIAYALDVEGLEDAALKVRCDRGQLHQALTNLLKNAAEAIETRIENGVEEGYRPEIRVALTQQGGRVSIKISDNGVGLPTRDRRRLLEPYVTTRDKGTGLGLAIVAKIVEEHHGVFELGEAEPFEPGAHVGAAARITLPLPSAVLREAAAPENAALDEGRDEGARAVEDAAQS